MLGSKGTKGTTRLSATTTALNSARQIDFSSYLIMGCTVNKVIRPRADAALQSNLGSVPLRTISAGMRSDRVIIIHSRCWLLLVPWHEALQQKPWLMPRPYRYGTSKVGASGVPGARNPLAEWPGRQPSVHVNSSIIFLFREVFLQIEMPTLTRGISRVTQSAKDFETTRKPKIYGARQQKS